MTAGLGLPPRVDDRDVLATDVLVVPHPGLGVDRLADGAQNAQAREVVLGWPLVAGLHEGANSGRRGVELRDAVLVDHLPEAAGVRVVGHALEHDRRGAERERTVHDVGVTGDPADVGGAEEDVVVVIVERVLHGHRRVDQVAAGGVQHALRLAGRPGGVEDEQRVLGVHPLDGAVVTDVVGAHLLVVPEVATRLHVDGVLRTRDHEHRLDAGALEQGLVGHGLERDDSVRHAGPRRR